MMDRWVAQIAFWIAMCGWQTVLAAGTPANTAIATQATAEYTVGASTLTLVSNVVTATVAELLNVHVTWQESTPVVTHPLDRDQRLTFRVTNTGNGVESFLLSGTGVVSGDDFDPAVTAIYLDSNDNNVFEAGTDSLYQAGVNDPSLAPDGSITVFALSNIPGNINDGDRGDFLFSATAHTGSGSPGDALSNMGDGGTDAVFGASGASSNTIGTYTASNADVSVTKSATILDPQGGALPATGAVITYQVQVRVTGSSTARSVVFSDPIPASTTYQPQSLHLNGTQLSDAQDSDAGDVDTGAANVVTVHLGDLANSSAVQTITFEVTIN